MGVWSREAQSSWQNVIKTTLNKAYRIISLGHSIKGQFNFVDDFDSKVVVVYNGPPEEIITKPPSKLNHQTPDVFNVLYLSNFIESKGFKDVIDAASILIEKGVVNAHFHFCGSFSISENSGIKNESDFWNYIQEKKI